MTLGAAEPASSAAASSVSLGLLPAPFSCTEGEVNSAKSLLLLLCHGNQHESQAASAYAVQM